MSVEAMGWAFRQQIPPAPALVLLALADQTDEETGRVCYGRTDGKHLAKKSRCSERGLYRHISALIRNGYILRESGRSQGLENTYWLCLDRAVTPLSEWGAFGVNIEKSDGEEKVESPQDVEGAYDSMAYPNSAEIHPQGMTRVGRAGMPTGGRARVSRIRRDIKPGESGKRVSGFSKKAQTVEIESKAIQNAATLANARYFVIEHSRAWNAWLDHRFRTTGFRSLPTTSGTEKFAGKRGWHFPSLFPPGTSAEDANSA